MTDITVPQSFAVDQYLTGVNASGVFTHSQVDYSQLSFQGVFGPKMTSNTENSSAPGVKLFTLDLNEGFFAAVDEAVQIKSRVDREVFCYGIITAVDSSSGSTVITVLVLRQGPLGLPLCSEWEIQKVPNFASEINSLYGYSATSLQFGSSHDIFVGATVAMTTDTNKLFRNSHVIVQNPTDSSQFFRGLVSAYVPSTGAISLLVTDVGASATGTLAAWVLFAQDGPGANAQLIATSTTSLTVGTGSKTITFLGGGGFTDGGIYRITDATNSSNWMLGQNQVGTAVSPMQVQVYTYSGSGTLTSWIITQEIPRIGASSAGLSGVTGVDWGPLQSVQLLDSAGNQQKPLIIYNNEVLTAARRLSIQVNDANRIVIFAADTTLSGTNTGDETAANILTKIKTVDGAGSGLDADLLDGISSAGFYQPGGTDVAVADGGTGASTAAGAATNLGLGTGDSPQFTAVNVGAATDTTLARVSAGVLSVEGNTIYAAGGTDVPVTDGGTGASTAVAGFNALSPLTTRGDILTRDATNNARVALGASGTLVSSDGTDTVFQTPLTLGLPVLVTSGSASGTSLDIVLTSYTGYAKLVFELINLIPATDATQLLMRVSTNGGSTYDASASNYFTGTTGGTSITLTNSSASIGNGAAEGISGRIELPGQTNTAIKPKVIFQMGWYLNDDTGAGTFAGSAIRNAVQDTDAVRFLFSSGNITSGTYRVWGFK